MALIYRCNGCCFAGSYMNTSEGFFECGISIRDLQMIGLLEVCADMGEVKGMDRM